MMKKMRTFLGKLKETDCDSGDFWQDPLFHPTLRSMSPRELGDLPFCRPYRRR